MELLGEIVLLLGWLQYNCGVFFTWEQKLNFLYVIEISFYLRQKASGNNGKVNMVKIFEIFSNSNV